MNTSGESKYLTPCRNFGLQRTHKRTPSSKGLTPLGGSNSLNAPFRSPLINDSTQSTPSAKRKSSSSLQKSSWTTPMLPKARIKMGLSKPSSKAHTLSVMQPKSLIQSKVGKPVIPSDSKEDKKGNKIAVIHSLNSLNKNILQLGLDSSDPSNNVEGEGDQPEDKIVSQLELPKSTSRQISEDPPNSSVNPHILEEILSHSESDSDGSHPWDSKVCPIKSNKENTHEKLGSSQESFIGWDLANDQESLDCDRKRDLFMKCIPNHDVGDCSSGKLCDTTEMTGLIQNKITSKSIQPLSFVKEKFRSKRRLLSDSEDSDCDSEESCSFQSKHSRELAKCNDAPPGNASVMQIRTKPGRSVFPEDDNDDSPSLLSKKENCDTNNSSAMSSLMKLSGVKKTKRLSKRLLLSDSDDDISEPFRPTRTIKSDSEGENVSTSSIPIVCVGDFVRKPDDCEISNNCLAYEQEELRPRLLKCEVGPAKAQSKGVSPSTSDHEVRETYVPDMCTPKMVGTPESLGEEDVDVKPASTVKKSKGTKSGRHESRTGICALSDSDDDSFFVQKPPEKRSKNEKVSSQSDFNSPKLRLAVELCRLPESALVGFADAQLQSFDHNSPSSNCGVESADVSVEDVLALQNNLKTYCRTPLKKPAPKKVEIYTKPPLDKLDGRLLLNNPVIPNVVDDSVKRRYIECFSETDDLERMRNEMQKWLVGGQQVISQIIEEVRAQRDKDMSVMEVLQEHNIDPNLVGYDPSVEEFVSFDNFLIKNDLM